MTDCLLSTENADTYTTLDTAKGRSAYHMITIFIFSQLCGYCVKITFGATKTILDQHSKNECIFIRAHLLHRHHKH